MMPQLNRQLTLEALQRTPDSAGGYTEDWHVLGQLWASVKAGTGKEAEFEGLSITTVSYKITVRAAPYGAPSRPAPGQRFRDGTRLFRLLAVTEANKNPMYLMCWAREEEVKV